MLDRGRRIPGSLRAEIGPPSPAGLGAIVVALALCTVLTSLIRSQAGVENAAIVYLLGVVAVGLGYGSWYAIGTGVASFLVYDFLYVQPLYTLQVGSAEEWVDLLLFLVVAAAIGRLSALQLERRREAELRSAEAQAMFAMSRDIMTASSALEAAPRLASRLAREAQMRRVWVGLGAAIGEERVVADSRPEGARPSTATRWTLQSLSSEMKPSWTRIHDSGTPGRPARAAMDLNVFRVPIAAGSEPVGSLWATRVATDPFPGRSHSRLMAAAADQLGQAVVRDRLAAEATAAEVARQGEALKSALLDSVSHDLRTPLAAIRATAGNLADPDVPWTESAQRAAAQSIDREADRLSRLLRNMLELGRIEGSALNPTLELYELADLVEPVVERSAAVVDPPRLEVAIPEDLPAVRVDGLFVDQILTNLIDNAVRYAAGCEIRISASADPGWVDLVVEDGGPGVPQSELGKIFERFYRQPGRKDSRIAGGSGIGLAVVRGLAEAMGGSVAARRSPLGGLAISVRFPSERVDDAAAEPAERASEPAAAKGPASESTSPAPETQP